MQAIRAIDQNFDGGGKSLLFCKQGAYIIKHRDEYNLKPF